MKKYAIPPKSNCKYITAGKKYKILHDHNDDLFNILDDDDRIIVIYANRCCHIDDKAWEIIEEREGEK